MERWYLSLSLLGNCVHTGHIFNFHWCNLKNSEGFKFQSITFAHNHDHVHMGHNFNHGPLWNANCIKKKKKNLICASNKNPWSGFFSARAIVSVCASNKSPDQGFLSARADRNYRTCREKTLIRGFYLLAQTETNARAEKNPWSGVSICSRRPKLLHVQTKKPWSGVSLCLCRPKLMHVQRKTPDQGFLFARVDRNYRTCMQRKTLICSHRPKLLHAQRKSPDQGFLSARADRNYCMCREKPLIRGFYLLAQTKTIARAEKKPWSGVSVCYNFTLKLT